MYHETRSVYSDIHLPTKNNITTPRPITDSKLKRTLNKDGDLAKLNVTTQDEKILALMVKRGEWEKTYWKKKLKNAVAWDKEKTASDEYRADTAREHRNSVESHREDDRQSLKLRKIAREKKRQEKRRQLEIELQKENVKTNKLLKEQQKLKEKLLKEKKEKEEKDKENQVKNWWDVNSKEYEKKYNDHLEHDKKRLHAGVKREEMIQDEKERIAKENETERMTFTERYVDYRRKFENSTHNLHIRLDRRLHTAEVNYEKQKKKREEKIKGDALEEQFKLEHAIKTQHKQAKKRQKITKNLWNKDEKKIEHANESLMSSLEKTAKHIREERQKHEEEQKKNLKLVRKKANAWKKKLRKDIKARDEKILQLQSDRVSVMETSRSVANDSRLLRNKVLDKYDSESFDKKLFRVQRFHSLGTRPSTQDWNSSTISLL